MKRGWRGNRLGGALALTAAASPSPAFACAACFGKSNSQMAISMNWGIFTLMGVIVGVLLGIATFFICLARRSARPARIPEEAIRAEPVPNRS